MRDAIIIGGGPAGASCALWLKKLGHEPLLIDSSKRLGGIQVDSPFENGWVVTSPPLSGKDMAKTIHRNTVEAGVACRLGTAVTHIHRGDDGFTAETEDGEVLRARFCALASGVHAATGGIESGPGIIFGPGPQIADQDFKGKHVAVLGGGDNALENYGFIRSRGAASVHVYARSVRGRRAFLDQIEPGDLSVGSYEIDADSMNVAGKPYDLICVFYGFVADTPTTIEPKPEFRPDGFLKTDDFCETSVDGLYAIGEVAARMVPSVVTSMADGVVAAKHIQARLEAD